MTIANTSPNPVHVFNTNDPVESDLTQQQLCRELLMALAANPAGKIARLETWKYNREESDQIFRIIDWFDGTLFQFRELYQLNNQIVDSYEKEINDLPKYKTLSTSSEHRNTIPFKDMAQRAITSCKKVSAFLRFQEELYKCKWDPDWQGRKDVLKQLPDYRSLCEQIAILKKQKSECRYL